MDSEVEGKLKPKVVIESQLLEGKTILVIDDNPINLIVAEKTLKNSVLNLLRHFRPKKEFKSSFRSRLIWY